MMMMMMMMMIYIIIITPADLVQWISHILDFTDFIKKKSPLHVSFAWKCFPQAQLTPLWILLWKMETRDWSKVLFTDRTELKIRIFFILSKAKGQSCVSAKTEWWGGEKNFLTKSGCFENCPSLRMVNWILGKPGGGAGQRGKVKGFEQRKGHCLQDQLSRQGDFLPTTKQS